MQHLKCISGITTHHVRLVYRGSKTMPGGLAYRCEASGSKPTHDVAVEIEICEVIATEYVLQEVSLSRDVDTTPISD